MVFDGAAEMGGQRNNAMIIVPPDFVTATVSREGDAGRAWINSLPRLVESLCQRWRLAIDGPVMHGYLGIVIPVHRADEPCVLKVSWRDETTADEALALAAWAGRGAVRLLASEPEHAALLLERLDHQHTLSNVAIADAVEVASRLLRRLAIPAPSGFRSLGAVARELSATLPERWERYGRPMPRRWIEHARELATQMGASSVALLVNYDLIYEDILRGSRESWLVVDPKVVSGDIEFGLAQLLWTRLEDIEANGGLERCFRQIIEAAGCDPARARAWTLVSCVDYWLWALSVGLTEDPARCESIVRWLI